MSKSSKFVTSLLVGAAGGAAAALFFTSQSGQQLKEKACRLAKDYQENPEEVKAELLHKAQVLKQQVTEKYEEVKYQFESGELTVEDLLQAGKEKTQELTSQSLEKWEEWKERLSEQAADEYMVEDILIPTVDLSDDERVIQDDIEITL